MSGLWTVNRRLRSFGIFYDELAEGQGRDLRETSGGDQSVDLSDAQSLLGSIDSMSWLQACRA